MHPAQLLAIADRAEANALQRLRPRPEVLGVVDPHPRCLVQDDARAHSVAQRTQRDRIREYAERFLGWLLTTAAVRLTEQQLWDRWAPQVAVNRREAPDLPDPTGAKRPTQARRRRAPKKKRGERF